MKVRWGGKLDRDEWTRSGMVYRDRLWILAEARMTVL